MCCGQLGVTLVLWMCRFVFGSCFVVVQVEFANKMECGFLAHGATGKGNDQVRFELSFAALDPTLQTIVPWRLPEFFNRFKGRPDLLQYAEETGIPVVQTASKPYSMDENMLHISYEAGVLEDPAQPHPEEMFRLTVDPVDAPDQAATVVRRLRKLAIIIRSFARASDTLSVLVPSTARAL